MSSESEKIIKEAEELKEVLSKEFSEHSIKSVEIALASFILELIQFNQWDLEDFREYFSIIWRNAEKIKHIKEN